MSNRKLRIDELNYEVYEGGNRVRYGTCGGIPETILLLKEFGELPEDDSQEEPDDEDVDIENKKNSWCNYVCIQIDGHKEFYFYPKNLSPFPLEITYSDESRLSKEKRLLKKTLEWVLEKERDENKVSVEAEDDSDNLIAAKKLIGLLWEENQNLNEKSKDQEKEQNILVKTIFEKVIEEINKYLGSHEKNSE